MEVPGWQFQPSKKQSKIKPHTTMSTIVNIDAQVSDNIRVIDEEKSPRPNKKEIHPK